MGKDIAARIKPSLSSPSFVDRWTKIGLLVSAVFSIGLALLVPSVVRLWYSIGTAIIPGLLIPVLSSYSSRLRIPRGYAFLAMLLGWLVSTIALLFGLLAGTPGHPSYVLGIEPMYPGLAAAVVVWGVGKIRTTP